MKRLVLLIGLLLMFSTFAQNEKLQWLSFPELETALKDQPKRVFIHFYADWCVYCKKMEKVVYTKPNITSKLKEDYYVIKFNVESEESILFGGKTFINSDDGMKRQAYHEIANLLAGQKNKSLELPAIVILDENFEIEKRFFRYIPPKEMLYILSN
ncbi:MAG: thioredoxin fold domain-containing protein [Winogradskyella sp.]|uniref:thioredoxin family protein n=1 Tax=Winogradskyella sp. TaxID=1883156 RepID=UPI0017A6E389|nr:thioredoxin fold domain-containing protein [Winogradskyella sp.]MBT8245808.1 thioredoxin fold domain-containing protein [Winogradskyella sp.]NNK22421.1 thioredoxin fold domain-containing protein [Winogradskyella sp.]